MNKRHPIVKQTRTVLDIPLVNHYHIVQNIAIQIIKKTFVYIKDCISILISILMKHVHFQHVNLYFYWHVWSHLEDT